MDSFISSEEDLTPPTLTSIQKYKTFIVSYFYQGDEWAFELEAVNERDARMRLLSMSNGVVDGELIRKKLLTSILPWLKNPFRWYP
jgi:hypothetical protein